MSKKPSAFMDKNILNRIKFVRDLSAIWLSGVYAKIFKENYSSKNKLRHDFCMENAPVIVFKIFNIKKGFVIKHIF